MFTGIIQDCGKVLQIEEKSNAKCFKFSCKIDEKHLKFGNSISINGVCLTVEDSDKDSFSATAVEETLSLTNLNDLRVGDEVNIEPALTLETPIAGHLVLGHVDGIAKVIQTGENFKIQVPDNFIKYCPKKGSICINGVSLTIAKQDEAIIEVALIPETLKRTNLGALSVGSSVNIEIDSLARYLEQLNKYS